MSHAVLSRYTEADDDVQPGGNGAPTGLLDLPDHERRLEDVARERAIWAWGRLRGIDQLDSQRAERILTEAILEAVAASRKPMEDERRYWSQVKAAARKLRTCVLKLWGETKAHQDQSSGSTKLCRVCGGTRNIHAAGCIVGASLAVATAAGIGRED